MMVLPKKIGPFTLMRRLNSDGVTESFAAILDQPAGKQVLVRRILPYVVRDAQRLGGVQGRIQDLTAVRHPTLVPILEVVEAQDEHWIIEEWSDGVDLERLLSWCRENNRTIPHNIYLNLATQICNGLEALHGRPGKASGSEHVLHLSLQPSAVMLTADAKLIVGGFGLVRSPTSMPQANSQGPVPARFEYLSPEQTHPDQKLSPASDIFSLGAVLYEMLTLEPLFKAASNLQTIHSVRKAEVTTQLLHVKEQLPGLDKVLYRALSLNPRHRYQRAFVLREDIRGLMAGFSFANITDETRSFLAPLLDTRRSPMSNVREESGISPMPVAPPAPRLAATMPPDDSTGAILLDKLREARHADDEQSVTQARGVLPDLVSSGAFIDLETGRGHSRDPGRTTLVPDDNTVPGPTAAERDDTTDGFRNPVSSANSQNPVVQSPHTMWVPGNEDDDAPELSLDVTNPGPIDKPSGKKGKGAKKGKEKGGKGAKEASPPKKPMASPNSVPDYRDDSPEPAPERASAPSMSESKPIAVDHTEWIARPKREEMVSASTPPFPLNASPPKPLAEGLKDDIVPRDENPRPVPSNAPAPHKAEPLMTPRQAGKREGVPPLGAFDDDRNTDVRPQDPSTTIPPHSGVKSLKDSVPRSGTPQPAERRPSPKPQPQPTTTVVAPVFDEDIEPKRGGRTLLFVGVGIAAVALLGLIVVGVVAVAGVGGFVAFRGGGTQASSEALAQAEQVEALTEASTTAEAPSEADDAPSEATAEADEPPPSEVTSTPAKSTTAATTPTPAKSTTTSAASTPSTSRTEARTESASTSRPTSSGTSSSTTSRPTSSSSSSSKSTTTSASTSRTNTGSSTATTRPASYDEPAEERSTSSSTARTSSNTISVPSAPASLVTQGSDLVDVGSPPEDSSIDYASFSTAARAGTLSEGQRVKLELVEPRDNEYTRAHVLLYEDAKSRGDRSGAKKYLTQVMSLPENQYRPEYVVEQAQLAFQDRDYKLALERAQFAERHWARLPSDLIFSRKAMMYEIEAGSWQGLFYESGGEDKKALNEAIASWTRFQNHVGTRKQTALTKAADEQLARLYEAQRRLE